MPSRSGEQKPERINRKRVAEQVRSALGAYTK